MQMRFMTVLIYWLLLYRYQGRLSTICVSVLRLWHRIVGQRAGDTGDYPSICGGSGSILREREWAVMLLVMTMIDLGDSCSGM